VDSIAILRTSRATAGSFSEQHHEIQDQQNPQAKGRGLSPTEQERDEKDQQACAIGQHQIASAFHSLSI
jgi:hypothetical protein